MGLHINWLDKERMIELDVQSSYYAITHTDYTQYYVNVVRLAPAMLVASV